MSTQPLSQITEAEFLAREERSEVKHEYYRGEVFAMSGSSTPHNRITSNIHGRLFQQLDGKPCQPNTSDVMVKVAATGLLTYPDVSVACPSVERYPGPIEVLLNPKVLIEVSSPSTEKHDRKTKLPHYQQIPALMEILLVDQDEAFIAHYQRRPDGDWTIAHYAGLDAVCPLPSIDCELPLAQVYSGVEFPGGTGVSPVSSPRFE